MFMLFIVIIFLFFIRVDNVRGDGCTLYIVQAHHIEPCVPGLRWTIVTLVTRRPVNCTTRTATLAPQQRAASHWTISCRSRQTTARITSLDSARPAGSISDTCPREQVPLNLWTRVRSVVQWCEHLTTSQITEFKTSLEVLVSPTNSVI